LVRYASSATMTTSGGKTSCMQMMEVHWLIKKDRSDKSVIKK